MLHADVNVIDSLIILFVFRMVVFAFVLSVLTINLLMITQRFSSDPSIFRFNVISLSTIVCGVSVVALLVPAWIITVPGLHVTSPLGFVVCLLFYHHVLVLLKCAASSIICFPLCHLPQSLLQQALFSFLSFFILC